MTELERKALLGDIEAQRKCTEMGIILPCPVCGKSVHWDFGSELVYHNYKDCFLSGKFIPLPYWNTRPAPPIGRCGECSYREKATVNNKGFLICPASGMEITNDDFCSYFEPKERDRNELD